MLTVIINTLQIICVTIFLFHSDLIIYGALSEIQYSLFIIEAFYVFILLSTSSLSSTSSTNPTKWSVFSLLITIKAVLFYFIMVPNSIWGPIVLDYIPIRKIDCFNDSMRYLPLLYFLFAFEDCFNLITRLSKYNLIIEREIQGSSAFNSTYVNEINNNQKIDYEERVSMITSAFFYYDVVFVVMLNLFDISNSLAFVSWYSIKLNLGSKLIYFINGIFSCSALVSITYMVPTECDLYYTRCSLSLISLLCVDVPQVFIRIALWIREGLSTYNRLLVTKNLIMIVYNILMFIMASKQNKMLQTTENCKAIGILNWKNAWSALQKTFKRLKYATPGKLIFSSRSKEYENDLRSSLLACLVVAYLYVFINLVWLTYSILSAGGMVPDFATLRYFRLIVLVLGTLLLVVTSLIFVLSRVSLLDATLTSLTNVTNLVLFIAFFETYRSKYKTELTETRLISLAFILIYLGFLIYSTTLYIRNYKKLHCISSEVIEYINIVVSTPIITSHYVLPQSGVHVIGDNKALICTIRRIDRINDVQVLILLTRIMISIIIIHNKFSLEIIILLALCLTMNFFSVCCRATFSQILLRTLDIQNKLDQVYFEPDLNELNEQSCLSYPFECVSFPL